MSRNYPCYTIEGVDYPRVTSILNVIRLPYLEKWRGDIGNEAADNIMLEACEIGSDIHGLAEEYATRSFFQRQGKALPEFLPRQLVIPDPYIEMMDSYIQWFDETIEEILPDPCGVEITVHSKRYGYAGTADLIARLKGDKYWSLIDLKTSKTLSATVPLQLAAYWHALLEMGIPVQRRMALKIDKINRGKEARQQEYPDHQKDLNDFLAALVLWRRFNQN